MYIPNARFYAIAGFAIAGVHCKPVAIFSPRSLYVFNKKAILANGPLIQRL